MGVCKRLFGYDFIREHTVKVFTDLGVEKYHLVRCVEIGEGLLIHKTKFVNEVSEVINQFNPEIVFGFNKMPGLDLYFAADLVLLNIH